MKPEIRYIDAKGREVHANVDQHPDECPICRKGDEYALLGCHFTRTIDNFRFDEMTDIVAAIYQCPRHSCRGVFVAYFECNRRFGGTTFRLRRFGPIYSKPRGFSDVIRTMSPKFPTIYNESLEAEENGLIEICGCGYGRALEFLVKDYLIYLGFDRDEVTKMRLGTAVSKIEIEPIQIAAERATWLRNDETHYERKWHEFDLQDLKNLIDLTVSSIEITEKTKKFKDDMPEGRK